MDPRTIDDNICNTCIRKTLLRYIYCNRRKDLVILCLIINNFNVPTYEKSDNDKSWGDIITAINKEDLQLKDHGFSELKPIKSDQDVPELWALKEYSLNYYYLKAIDENFRFVEKHDEITSESEAPIIDDLQSNEQIDNIKSEAKLEDDNPAYGYIKDIDNPLSNYSQEYVDYLKKDIEETIES